MRKGRKSGANSFNDGPYRSVVAIERYRLCDMMFDGGGMNVPRDERPADVPERGRHPSAKGRFAKKEKGATASRR